MEYSVDGMSGVRSIPGLGTTWVRRGPAYWFRRTLISLGSAAVCFFVGLIYVSVAIGLWSAADSSVARTCIVVAFVVAGVWSTAAAIRAFRPAVVAMRNKDITALRDLVDRPAKRRWGATAAGSGIGFAGLAGSGVAVAVLGLGSIFVIGWPIVMLALSFRRYWSIAECLAVIELESAQSERTAS